MNEKTDDTGGHPEPAEQDMPEDAMPEASDIEPASADPGETPPGEHEGPTLEEAPGAVAAPAAPRRGIAPAVAALSLLLAIASLAVSGWLAWQNRDSGTEAADNEAAIATLSDELDATAGSLQERLDAAMSELRQTAQQTADRNEQRIATLRRDFEELVEQAESLAPRVGSLENAVSSLQGISAGMRDTWLLAEAEYYLQMANAQLQLAGNPRVAALALGFADELVRQAANPALREVRLALTRELQALQAMETVDLEGITLALASLADRVDALPLNETVDVPEREQAAVDPDLSGWARAWASIRSAFGDIVSVRRTDEALTPLLSPDAVYFLRANLALKFQAARLALLRGEQAVFEQSLDDAADWLEEYYDTQSQAVRNALKTLSDLKDREIDLDPPDISESLRLLRQHRAVRQAEASVDAEAGGPEPDEPRQ